ncbi:hypothetical protein ACJX0J_005323, partial [Zea mays]
MTPTSSWAQMATSLEVALYLFNGIFVLAFFYMPHSNFWLHEIIYSEMNLWYGLYGCMDSMMHATFINITALSKQSNSRNGNINSLTSRAQLQKLSTMTPTSSWAQMVMDLYPPGSSS